MNDWQRLWDENDTLRERIRQLEHEMGHDPAFPSVLGLSPGETKILGMLMSSPGVCSKERLFTVIYGAQDDAPSIKIIDVYICKIREKLRELAVEIITTWGQGFHLTQVSKEAINAIITDHGDDMTQWTDEKTKLGIKMWKDGESGQEIALALDPRGGLSRNAVIGKMHRLNIAQGKRKDGKPAPVRGPKRDRAVTLPSGKVVTETNARAVEKSNESRRGATVPITMPHAPGTEGYMPFKEPPAAAAFKEVAQTFAHTQDAITRAFMFREPIVEQSAKPIPFTECKDTRCRFPLWSSYKDVPLAEKFCCGARIPNVPGRYYCETHQAVMYTEKPTNRRPYVGMRTGQ